jgi:hypothetical protein
MNTEPLLFTNWLCNQDKIALSLSTPSTDIVVFFCIYVTATLSKFHTFGNAKIKLKFETNVSARRCWSSGL